MGKSSVIYVIGLSLIVGIMLMNINKTAVESVDTYTLYFGRTMAHNISLAAANLGSNRVLFSDFYHPPDNFTGSFAGGTFAVLYSDTGFDENSTKFVQVTSSYEASGETIRDTLREVFRVTLFSRFGWFTEKENNGYVAPDGTKGGYYGASDWKITGDSVFGLAHTNDHFNLAGSPYFDKKVTAKTAPNLAALAGITNPIYNEGNEWGVTIKRDSSNITNLKSFSNQGGAIDTSLLKNNDVFLNFQSDSVKVTVKNTSNVTVKDTTILQARLSTSGVFGVQSGDLHIKGTYKGSLTVAAFKGASGASTNKGNVWFDGSLLANVDPQTNPASTDMLGVFAERMGYLTKDLTRTPTSVVKIEAAIYCQDGEFTAEDFTNIPVSGRVSLFGSLVQNTAGSLGVFNFGTGLTNGYYYSVRHDDRFLKKGPPHSPFSKKFLLVSWWEN